MIDLFLVTLTVRSDPIAKSPFRKLADLPVPPVPQLYCLCKEDPGSQRGDNEWDSTVGGWFRCGK